MDHLKEGIGLRGYGQHDPLVEYKRESFDMFEEMMQRFQEETVRYLYLMQIMERPPDPAAAGWRRRYELPARGPKPAYLRHHRRSRRQRTPAAPGRTSVDEIEEAFQRKKKKELEQARMAGAGDMQVQQVVRSGEKSGATILAPAAAARNIRSAAAPKRLLISCGLL